MAICRVKSVTKFLWNRKHAFPDRCPVKFWLNPESQLKQLEEYKNQILWRNLCGSENLICATFQSQNLTLNLWAHVRSPLCLR